MEPGTHFVQACISTRINQVLILVHVYGFFLKFFKNCLSNPPYNLLQESRACRTIWRLRSLEVPNGLKSIVAMCVHMEGKQA